MHAIVSKVVMLLFELFILLYLLYMNVKPRWIIGFILCVAILEYKNILEIIF